MVIVLKKNSTEEQKKNIETILEKKNFRLNVVSGEEDTIIAAVGKVSMDIKDVEILPGVDKVIPISKPYKMASRQFKGDDTVVEVSNCRGQKIRIGGKHLVAIAGPSAVESREQIMKVAEKCAAAGAVMLRAGTFMPRSSPYSFQGLGEKGLDYLREAGDAFGLPVVTEITSENLISVMKDKVDVFQIGARNMQNFDLLKKVGAVGKPVILKRSYTATLEEFLMSAEYLLASGTNDVILCERGIRTFEHATHNTLDLSAVPLLRKLTHLPIIVDPSHAVGLREMVSPMALASVSSGADGISVEVHDAPEKAFSGGAFSMVPAQFEKLMKDIEALAPVMEKSVTHIKHVDQTKTTSGLVVSDKPVVAYCGKPGCNAEAAIHAYFDTWAQTVPLNSFEDIFQNVVDGKVDYGMVPIENSLGGSVYQNYDNFKRFQDVSISGAVAIKISYCLLGVKGSKMEDIKKVYSHPQSFLQTRGYLSGHKEWQQIEAYNTSGAALFVSETGSRENAAIASAVNASLYNLDILEEGIEDDPNNYTRFVIISANHLARSGSGDVAKFANKKPTTASFMVKAKNEPGSLHNILGVFEENRLNLTRIESRPVSGQPWRYWFYLDLELTNAIDNPQSFVSALTEKIRAKSEEVRLLGIYSE